MLTEVSAVNYFDFDQSPVSGAGVEEKLAECSAEEDVAERVEAGTERLR